MAKPKKMAKERAGRNRTIALAKDEYNMLSANLLNFKKRRQIKPCDILDKTINNDLLDIIDALPKQFADLIIIDPPYNLTKDFNGFTFKSSSKKQYLDYIYSWLPKVASLLKPNGSMYLCGDWRCSSALQQAMEESLIIINRITWQREKGRGALRNWKNGMEDIWFGVKNAKNYYFNAEAVKLKRKVLATYKKNGQPKGWEKTSDGNFRLTYPSNFWDDISIPYWSMPENTDHPTQKPEKLIAKLILASCPEGGIVFDPFLGSGTTSVVAKKLGRHYCGIEMNKEYCCLAEKRLQKAKHGSPIQGYASGVFWERNSLKAQLISLQNLRSSLEFIA